MYTVHCIHKARSIVDDPTHPSHTLFTLLPSGKRPGLHSSVLPDAGGRDLASDAQGSGSVDNSFSSTTTLSTGAPQGCVLSPLLFTLLTHNCAAMHSSNHIIKFADDMTVVGLISKNDKSAYRESDHSPLFISGSPVEIVRSTKFLGVHLVENFTWSLNTTSITKKAQQHLYFLRNLRKDHLPPTILTMFYRGTIESVLSSCITAWFRNCTVSDRKTLQRIVRTVEKIISLPSIMDIYTTRCIRKANSIVDDPTHPSHTLFGLLPSGKRMDDKQLYVKL
ncbi:hypothetical protein QTP70_002302 [Hemibagrus guttatus]|uniref:Reverse transcriptase domain-containing protein n=1 Tax=Hemibagrus guttatus TaxID=175788 RepID=A0AAE0QBB1_9TELE|nr:hypothetical protein QTP70_002302 [Hemibagrus guttatus]